MSSAPTAGAARSSPGPTAPLQDVLREDRQQRRRATQQHREEVERDGAQHHLVPQMKSEAANTVAATTARRHHGPRGIAEDASDERQTSSASTGRRRRRRRRVEESAERGPADHRDLHHRGADRHGARQLSRGTSEGTIACCAGVCRARAMPSATLRPRISSRPHPAVVLAPREHERHDGLQRDRREHVRGDRRGRPAVPRES